MTNVVMVCSVCDKVGKAQRKNGLPVGWRRLTISNPETLQKRGVTGYVCQVACAARYVKKEWGGST